MMKVKIKKLAGAAIIPEYQSEGASGFDFHSVEDVIIDRGCTTTISTGLAMSIPTGFELQIRPRSGLSLKTGLRVANAPGTIDSDYRGEIKIIIHNASNRAEEIKIGDRIAQGVVAPVKYITFEEGELDETERGEGGFGSTGKD